MYKIQNATNGILSLSLENGGVSLIPGQYIDLDRFCSRDWINNDSELRHLLKHTHIRLVHDSTDTTDTRRIHAYVAVPPPPVVNSPIVHSIPLTPTNPKGSTSTSSSVVVIDLSNKGELKPAVSTAQTVTVVEPVVTTTAPKDVNTEIVTARTAAADSVTEEKPEEKPVKKSTGSKSIKKKTKG